MIRILSDYKTYEENIWWFNRVITAIIQAFGIVDNGTEYFTTDGPIAPASDKVPMRFQVEVSEAGTYFYSTNQSHPKSFHAPNPGTYDIFVLLDRGLNTVRVLNAATLETSKNVIHLDNRFIYGWIPAALALQFLEIADGISILRSFYNLQTAPVEILDAVYGSKICLSSELVGDDTVYRRILAAYYAARPLGPTVQAIRTALLGFPSLQDTWLSLHHLEPWDMWFTYAKLRDQSTWLPLRDNSIGYEDRTVLACGALPPDIYDYVILAHNYSLGGPTHISRPLIDCRHWMKPSSLVLRWIRVGIQFDTALATDSGQASDYRYDIYRKGRNDTEYICAGRTNDNCFIDVGPTPFTNGIDPLSASQVNTQFSGLTPFTTNTGRNAFVRTIGHVTSQDIVVYLDNLTNLQDWEKQSITCILDELFNAHVRYTTATLNSY